MLEPTGSGKPYPDKLHLDGYRVEKRFHEADGLWRVEVTLRLDNDEVQYHELLRLSDTPEVRSLLDRVVEAYAGFARYFTLLNGLQRAQPASPLVADVRTGMTELFEFCAQGTVFQLTDWTYLSSRAPDDHFYKHNTENRFLRVVEDQFTEELTEDELARMLARDQEADQESW